MELGTTFGIKFRAALKTNSEKLLTSISMESDRGIESMSAVSSVKRCQSAFFRFRLSGG